MLKHWPVLIIFVLGFYVRSMYLSSGAFPFSYDQARDAYTIKELLRGDIKIQGPPTSTHDFFHGVLFYYALAPGYFLGHGSPVIATIWIAFINSFGILLFYYFALQIFSNRFLAGLGALFWALSYDQTQYAFYLTNTGLAPLTVPLLYLGLYLWMKNKKNGPILAGIGLGLSIQANFLLIYHSTVVALTAVLKKIPLSKANVFGFTTFLILALSTMIISEIKFGFPSRNGPLSLLNRSSYSALKVTSSTILSSSTHQLERLVGLNLYPTNTRLAILGFIAFLIVFSFKKNKPEWWWPFLFGIFSFAPPLMLGGISSPYIHAGLASLVFIFVIYFFKSLYPKYFPVIALVSVLIIISNVRYIQKRNSQGLTEFAIQKTMTLDHELAAIDYIYSEAKGLPFSFNSITAPLYINTTWSYLFNWYGKSKYGYLPYWHGHDQVGSLGNNLIRPPKGVERYFVIIEPSQGLPQDIINQILEEENGFSTFNHKKQFGEITVQNRTERK